MSDLIYVVGLIVRLIGITSFITVINTPSIILAIWVIALIFGIKIYKENKDASLKKRWLDVSKVLIPTFLTWFIVFLVTVICRFVIVIF